MLPFKPYVWTGWEYGGIGICCESDNGFELENPWECITVTSDDEYTNIHIAILDNMPIDWQGRKEDWGNNLNAICYTFGIQATPVKPKKKDFLKNWRVGYCHFAGDDSVYRKVDGNGDTFIEEMYAKGVRAIILHENWSLIQNYGFPKNDQRLKQFVDDCHMLGMKVIPYFGYEVSSLYPDFSKERDNFLNKNVKGNSVGGWQRPPMQRAFIACYKGGYSDVLIERVKYVMDNYGFDGIYTDGTYVPWECANETHGCGYRDRNGNLKHVYPIFAVREHVKKLYAAVHERGGIIDTHQSSCCLMATLAFADSYQDGENIQPMIQESVENMKMDTFRAEYTGLNMGLAANFIAYTAKDATIERLAGIGLLHNVYPRARIDDLDYMSAIWRVLDKFDFLQAKWVPYWENKNIITENEKTYITYYKKEDALLIILVNYNKNADKIRVKLDKKYSSAFDELDNNNEIILTDDIMILPVKYADLMMIGVKSI